MNHKIIDLTPEPLEIIQKHFQGLYLGEPKLSRIKGGQTAADQALANLDITGYAKNRSQVLPKEKRGASVLSPYIRHNLLTLQEVYDKVSKAPYQDREKFRDELYWQEYARHLYARIGTKLFQDLRFELNQSNPGEGWNRDLNCINKVITELETDGWLVNQTRMWLASDWAVRHNLNWLNGQEKMYQQLIDGSRAANLLGWQWTAGSGTGKPYGFARWQVEKRAPELCANCELKNNCPIQEFPNETSPTQLPKDPLLDFDPDLESTIGPLTPLKTDKPDYVLLTIDSLGDSDPALKANPNLPVVFIFNEPALKKLQLSSRRIGFYLETLKDLSQRRELKVLLSKPYTFTNKNKVAVTFAPVPSFKKFTNLAEIHPYPWLVTPKSNSVRSYSSWRSKINRKT